MTTHEMTVHACAKLQHQWELQGSIGDPATLIRRIALELSPGTSQVCRQLEEAMFDRWMQLHAGNDI